jgi:adenylate kinase
MAPIQDDTVDALKDLVGKLEARVGQLEAKLADKGRDRQATAPAESIRMILMGPPGAGTSDVASTWRPTLILPGKGTQAPKIKEKYCACHLVRVIDSTYTGSA